MPFLREVTLKSEEVGNFWAATSMNYSQKGMVIKVQLSLFKSAAAFAAHAEPLPKSYNFTFTVTPQQLTGNIIALAHTKIAALIDQLHTPITGSGDPVSHYPDLVGYTIV